jgi:proteic killer suppression protein
LDSVSFCCLTSHSSEDTEALSKHRAFVNIAKITAKAQQLEIANGLDDLRVPPGNHLEALKGNRSGQHSIRINDQWQLCFRWTKAGAEKVSISRSLTSTFASKRSTYRKRLTIDKKSYLIPIK